MNPIFLDEMRELLGEEDYLKYLSLLDEKGKKGFRINSLKIKESEFFELFPYKNHKSPFAKNGYYLDEEVPIGKTLLYAAGLLYMQEASASSAVTILDVKPGMKVLDLCAAPGSKSTQILEALNGEGLLIANEYIKDRAQILKENIERCGAYNAIICNADTKIIADAFENYFDAVLCDAPCSGEGMFRKEPNATINWSIKNIELCASRQEYILDNAYRALKPSGVLVYSTCTFNKKENEYQILNFLDKHRDMEIMDTGCNFGRKGLLTQYATNKAIRIYPMDGGEGHFICKLRKKEQNIFSNKQLLLKSELIPNSALNFFQDMFEKDYPYYYSYKGKIYGGTIPFIGISKANLIRHQVYLGEEIHGRFEPSYALFMSSYTKFKRVIPLSDEEAKQYMLGLTINKKCDKGYYAVSWKNHNIGYVKSDGTVLKNKLPKAYRQRG